MRKFKIVPLSREYARKIRLSGKDEFGHAVCVQKAKGLGPCRVSLRTFNTALDTRILISHSPFEIDNAYNQPGPIFIDARDVEVYKDIHRFPPQIRNDGIHFLITLIGYSVDQVMKLTHLCSIDESVDLAIEKIFDSRPDIAFIHARNAIACCYICRIDRVPESLD